MLKYKVFFENNKAAATVKLNHSNHECVRIEYPDGISMIQWLVVYANSERDSIVVANTIVKNIGFERFNNKDVMEGTSRELAHL